MRTQTTEQLEQFAHITNRDILNRGKTNAELNPGSVSVKSKSHNVITMLKPGSTAVNQEADHHRTQ